MSNFDQAKTPSTWTPSPWLLLWTELERLHEKLELDPPTATFTIEDLEAEVERLKQEGEKGSKQRT